MLSDLIEISVYTSLPFLLIGLFCWNKRLKWWWFGIVLILTLRILVAKGFFQVGELHMIPGYVDLIDMSALLILWVFFSQLLATVGFRPPGPPILSSALCGATMGVLASAILLPSMAKDKDAAARLVLASAGGALIGRIGDPAILLLSEQEPSLAYALIPLGVVFVLIAGPKADDIIPSDDLPLSPVVLAFSVILLTFIFPEFSFWILSAGILGLLPFAGLRFFNPQLWLASIWTLGICLLVVASTAGGLPELMAWGLEDVQINNSAWILPGLGFIGLLGSTLIDPNGAALFIHAFFDRALDLNINGAVFVFCAGAAAGGFQHLIIAGVFRRAFYRWCLQMLAAVVFILILCQWVFL